MDVNGTRYHLVQGARDWSALITDPSELTFDVSSQSLELAAVVERFKTTASVEPLLATDRRGADCDQFGNWHWIDEDRHRVMVLSCGSTEATRFWSADDLTPSRCEPCDSASIFTAVDPPTVRYPGLSLSGLAITERHYMVIGTVDPSGLLVFDLHAGGGPVFTPWPEALQLEPFDMATAPRGGAWILDRGTPLEPARYWRLDSWLRPVPAAGVIELAPAAADQFAPVGGVPVAVDASTFAAGQSLSASPIDVEAPRSIVGLPDDSILVLDSPESAPHSRVVRFVGGARAGEVALDAALLGETIEPPAEVLAHDIAFVPDGDTTPGVVRGTLYAVGVDGNQAFAFDLEADGSRLELRFRPEQLPLRRFGGKALECCGGRVWYDLGNRWMPVTVHPRRRFVNQSTLDGLVFDGKLPDCHWGRLILDACVPEDASVTIDSRVANERPELEQQAWRREPPLYLRGDGAEIPFYEPFAGGAVARGRTGSWETLLQSARGRFLELRLTISGAGRQTPRLRALRVYYPAFSYLDRYLPAVYREDPVSASFLDRYLANAEGMFTALEGRIAAADGLFDSRVAPPEYLDWLAGWFGTAMDPDWDEARRRLFLEYAELLFRWRGTPAGLLAMIRLAIDPCPTPAIFEDLLRGRLPADERYAGASVRLVESFLTRRFSGVSLGDPTVPDQPGLGADGSWTPEQGVEPLHQRYRTFLHQQYAPGQPAAAAVSAINDAWSVSPPIAALSEIRLSPRTPAGAEAADWRRFIDAGIGFVYMPVADADVTFYRTFLKSQWGTINALNDAWQLAGSSRWASFEAITLPTEFPTSGYRLRDWIQFVSLALPIRSAAHQFTVLIPVLPGESGDEQRRRIEIVNAVVAREKPAHTDFQIKPYWALFRAGTARLGIDTALGAGARFTGIELGLTALGEGYLAFGHPWNVRDRAVVGRDAVAEIRP